MPFRLTRQMTGALQPHDALALLQAPCALALTALCSGKDILEVDRPFSHWSCLSCVVTSYWSCLLGGVTSHWSCLSCVVTSYWSCLLCGITSTGLAYCIVSPPIGLAYCIVSRCCCSLLHMVRVWTLQPLQYFFSVVLFVGTDAQAKCLSFRHVDSIPTSSTSKGLHVY